MHACPQGRFRLAEKVGDFGEGKVLEYAKFDQEPFNVSQGGEKFFNGNRGESKFIDWRRRRFGNDPGPGLDFTVIPALRVEQGVAGDAEQPTRKGAGLVELIEMRKSLDECFLGQIFVEMFRGSQDPEKHQELGKMPSHQVFGGRTITAPDGSDQVGIRSVRGKIIGLGQETSRNQEGI